MSCMQFRSKRSIQSQHRNRRIQMLWVSSYRSRSQSEETGETGEWKINNTLNRGRSIDRYYHLIEYQ